MKLLMHICCANCGLYPIKHLGSKGIDIKGLWFNPNIHPASEYKKRLAALQTLEREWGLDIEYIDHYGLEEFLLATKGVERCTRCYRMRLRETARTARKMGLDGFTTSLLVSPYQKFELLVEAGRDAEREFSVPFYLEDFRPGYRDGVKMSRELGLYRQRHCGCIYSGMEREMGRGK